MQTRQCGAVHPDGVMCSKSIYWEPGCCHDKTYAHEPPHEFATPDGVITHRWEEVMQIKDWPYDGYRHHKNEEG